MSGVNCGSEGGQETTFTATETAYFYILCAYTHSHIDMMITCKATARFQVFDLDGGPARAANEETEAGMMEHLKVNGCFVARGLFGKAQMEAAAKATEKLVEYLKGSSYDTTTDELVDLDMDEWDIVRVPRINPGKHNVHFGDSSAMHLSLQSMIEESSLLSTLEECYEDQHGRKATFAVRESGISLTAPMTAEIDQASTSTANAFRSGTELHADGGMNEATVLMSLRDDVDDSMGPLLVVPRSKDAYDEEIGHNPASLLRSDMLESPSAIKDIYLSTPGVKPFKRKATAECCDNLPCLKYSYRSGAPMIMDSRTLHGALPNTSSRFRVIYWLILENVNA